MSRPSLPNNRAPLHADAFLAHLLGTIQTRGWLQGKLLLIVLSLSLLGLVISACAPPPEMIATLTQLPLTPTLPKPTRAATSTFRPTITYAVRDSGTTTPGVSGGEPAGLTPVPDPNQPTTAPNRPDLPYINEPAGQVIANNQVAFDAAQDSPGCALRWLSFSPTYEHFLVVPFCAGGKNLAFLFNIDGTDRREISASEEFMQDGIHAWSPDGQMILFYRNHSDGVDEDPSAPPPGLVIYDVAKGDKQMILNAEENPDFGAPSSLRWSPDGQIIAFLNFKEAQDITEINLIYPDGSDWQILDEFPGPAAGHTLSWIDMGAGNFQLEYRDEAGEIIRAYPIAP